MTLVALAGLKYSLALVAAPIGSAMTYSGRLGERGEGANGRYDLRFRLFDEASAGTAFPTVLTNFGVTVSNGTFAVTLDFDSNAFDGTAYWLEVGVRTNGGGEFTLLAPRQQLSPIPYSLYALTAEHATQALLATTVAAHAIGPDALQSNSVTAEKIAGGTIRPTHLDSTAFDPVFWRANGNLGTDGRTNFLGTLDNQPLEFKVNNQRALRLEPGFSSVGPNVIAGLSSNLGPNVGAATISGGKSHQIGWDAHGASIGGGIDNQIGDLSYQSVISGGLGHRIDHHSHGSVIGGGWANQIGPNAAYATVAGGEGNSITQGGFYAAIGGGRGNAVGLAGFYATIGGGYGNRIALEGTAGESNYFGTISGGRDNRIDDASPAATVSGGKANSIAAGAGASVIGGGIGNSVGRDGTNVTISGGWNNRIADTSPSATIGGGEGNAIAAQSGSSVIGGGNGNQVTFHTFAATIGGGNGNVVQGESRQSTIGGGESNIIGSEAEHATIAGGRLNRIGGTRSEHATIGGGLGNSVNTYGGTVAGGEQNTISDISPTTAHWGVIGGGLRNLVAGEYAVVPGGLECEASGAKSFAAGTQAKARHAGSFVLSDGQLLAANSTNDNSFTARFTGGFRLVTANNNGTNPTAGVYLAPGSGTWASLSDRASKENHRPVDPRTVLEKVAALPITDWNYKAQDRSIRHLGPMAQDFHAAFHVGDSDTTITTVDADGVALAAIQGLNRRVTEERDQVLETLRAREVELTELRTRLRRVEAILSRLTTSTTVPEKR